MKTVFVSLNNIFSLDENILAHPLTAETKEIVDTIVPENNAQFKYAVGNDT